MKKPILEVKNLRTTFRSRLGPVNVVNDISYDLQQGEILGIVGESGCGKSVACFSLMKLIEHPGEVSGGQVLFNGKDLLKLSEEKMESIRGNEMAMIFQEPMTALNPVLTIGHQISEQIQRHLKLSPKLARERGVEMLSLVGIPSPHHRYDSYPHQLSGGMRQRSMIAMALSCHPQFLIADEPTTALDVTIQAQILELIQEFQEKLNMSVQFISHDLGVISEISDRTLVMYGGRLCEIAPTQDLFLHPAHPYTEALIGSRPKLGRRSERLSVIEGTVPAPHELPVGCPFYSRCHKSKPECEIHRPELRDLSPQHSVSCFFPVETL